MTTEQKKRALKIKEKLTSSGVSMAFLARKFKVSLPRISATLGGNIDYVSDEFLGKVEKFVNAINTNDIKVE